MIAIGSLFAAANFLKLEASALYCIINMLGNKLHFALFKTAERRRIEENADRLLTRTFLKTAVDTVSHNGNKVDISRLGGNIAYCSVEGLGTAQKRLQGCQEQVGEFGKVSGGSCERHRT